MRNENNDTRSLYLMTLQQVESNELDEAQKYIEKALLFEPDNVIFQLTLANILKTKGSMAAACELLLTITKNHPDSAAAFNNLGTIYYAQNQLEQALAAYEAAIDIQPNYIDAYYNLGLTLSKANRYQVAMQTYAALITLSPQHLAARFQLACLFMQQHQYEKAVEQFLAIEKNQPHHFETKINLGTCYLKLQNLHAAKAMYLQAYDLLATDAQVLFNLGIIYSAQGEIHDAIRFYLLALKKDPDLFSAHNNLGIAYWSLKNKQAALLHFRSALKLQPSNIAIKHTINILNGEKNISVSPPEYISHLFDSYASYYDAHLTQTLSYEVPQLMYDAICQLVEIKSSSWDILDLGCGTGLCGERFKQFARSLTGVDLSEKMLELAQLKNIYTEIHRADFFIFLSQNKKNYDLIIAGDVLVYVGYLSQLIADVNCNLKSDGYFVFNTELMEGEGYLMTESGRFAHGHQGLQQLAREQNFEIISQRIFNLRKQNNLPVRGLLNIWKKL